MLNCVQELGYSNSIKHVLAPMHIKPAQWFTCPTMLILTVLMLVVSFGTSLGSDHNAAFKSVHQAEFECQRYLPLGSEHDCSAYCEQQLLRSWHDEFGVLAVRYGRYYQPHCDDVAYYNRTTDCIHRESSPRDSFCRRSSVSRRCYREHYGDLHPTASLILNMPKLLLQSNLQQCSQIVKVPEEAVIDYQAILFQQPQEARCLLRCLLIREGLYNDRDGPDAHRTFIQCGGYGVREEDFTRQLRICVNSIWARHQDPCKRAALVLFECIPP